MITIDRHLRLPLVVAFALSMLVAEAQSSPEDPLRQRYDAASNYQRAGDLTRAALEYKAFLAEALHRIANGEAQAGEFDNAFPLFAEALSFAPTDPQLRLDYASASFDAEKLTQARQVLEPVAQASPRNAPARYLLGRILFQLGEYAQAKGELEAAVAVNPDFNTGYLLGKIYLLLHEEKKARTLFDEMISGLGNSPLIHIYFGRAYSLMDYPDQAVQEFEKAIALDSHAPDAHYYLALAYMRHDESAGYDQAVPELQAELKVNPNDARSRSMLGYIALKQRRFADSEKELTQAVALQPRDANPLVNLAEVYTAENRIRDAEATLRKAIEVVRIEPANAPQSARAHYLLGRLLLKDGRAEEGKREMVLAANLDSAGGMASGPSGEARAISSSAVSQEQNRERSESPARPATSEQELQRLKTFRSQLSPIIGQVYNNLAAIAEAQKDPVTAQDFRNHAAVWSGK